MIRAVLLVVTLATLASCGSPETEFERDQRLRIAEAQAAERDLLREEVEALNSEVGGYWLLAVFAAGMGFWGFQNLSARSRARLAVLGPLESELGTERTTVRQHESAIAQARAQAADDLAAAERLEQDARILFARLRERESGASP